MSDPTPTHDSAQPPETADETWKVFPLSAYLELIQEMSHFSMKTVNSNAEAGGIRLTSASALKLPYLSVRTLIGSGQTVALDYLKDAAKATRAKQLQIAMTGKAPLDEGPAICAAYQAALDKPMETGLDHVSPRLRQILLPRAAAPNGYLSITPLSAAGTASLTAQWVRDHNAARKAGTKDKASYRRVRTATLGFGGSKPINVGFLTRDLQSLIVAEGPTESPYLRAALALHYKGPELRMPPQAVAAYADWRAEAMAANQGHMPTDLPHRETERKMIQAVAQAVMASVEKQCSVLIRHEDRLPWCEQPDGERSLFARDVPAWRKGLLEPGWRHSDWARETGRHLAAAVLHHRNAQGESLGLGDDAREVLGRMIEEVLP